jgi:hypothetical protein
MFVALIEHGLITEHTWQYPHCQARFGTHGTVCGADGMTLALASNRSRITNRVVLGRLGENQGWLGGAYSSFLIRNIRVKESYQSKDQSCWVGRV